MRINVIINRLILKPICINCWE